LEHNPHPDIEQVKEAIAGNLCRCTGYKRIVKGILTAAEQMSDWKPKE
jgi:carbon-monoxide dehydrogenase small subunit